MFTLGSAFLRGWTIFHSQKCKKCPVPFILTTYVFSLCNFRLRDGGVMVTHCSINWSSWCLSMLSKTDLCASEPQYKMKTEFAVMRNSSFPGQRKLQQAKVLKNWKPPEPRRRDGESGYVEIQDLPSFHRSCVSISGLPHHVFRLDQVSETEGSEGRRRDWQKRRKGYLI